MNKGTKPYMGSNLQKGCLQEDTQVILPEVTAPPPSQGTENFISDEEIDEMLRDLGLGEWRVRSNTSSRQYNYNPKFGESKDWFEKAVTQPQTIIYNVYFIGNMEQEDMKNILGQFNTFNGSVNLNYGSCNTMIANTGMVKQKAQHKPQAEPKEEAKPEAGEMDEDFDDEALLTDLKYFAGNTKEKMENRKKVGEKLHTNLQGLNKKSHDKSKIITQTILECFGEGWILYVPTAPAFKRLFKQYFADNIISIDDKVYNRIVKKELSKKLNTIDKR